MPATQAQSNFKELVDAIGDKIIPFRERDVVPVTVIQVTNHWIVVDVMGLAEGFIPRKEFSTNSERLQKGDTIEAAIMLFEDDAGRMVLSLKRADREKYLTSLRDKFEQKESFEAKVVDANKGGLIIEVGGIQGFMPVSQLTSAHYPRVEGGDKQRILDKLKSFTGKNLLVRVITFEPQAGKIIFSEKAAVSEEQEQLLKTMEPGMEVQGVITGIADFGLFVTLTNGLEGLVHIREVAWEAVGDLRTRFSVGDEITAQVLQIQGGRLSLSLKRNSPDPFAQELKKIKVKSKLTGDIVRLTPIGGYLKLASGLELHVTLPEGVAVSQLPTDKPVELTVLEIEPAEHRAKVALVTKTAKTE